MLTAKTLIGMSGCSDFRTTILYIQLFVKAYTCYRFTAVTVILVNHEFSLLNVSFKEVIEKQYIYEP